MNLEFAFDKSARTEKMEMRALRVHIGTATQSQHDECISGSHSEHSSQSNEIYPCVPTPEEVTNSEQAGSQVEVHLHSSIECCSCDKSPVRCVTVPREFWIFIFPVILTCLAVLGLAFYTLASGSRCVTNPTDEEKPTGSQSTLFVQRLRLSPRRIRILTFCLLSFGHILEICFASMCFLACGRVNLEINDSRCLNVNIHCNVCCICCIPVAHGSKKFKM